jgi:hypothetical protein
MASMRVRRCGGVVLGVASLLTCLSAGAAAQPADPNPGALTITGATDVASAYMFRGIRHEDENLILWPYFDLGIALHSGDGLVKSVSVNVGTWNSLHRGLSGSSGPSGKFWFESDFYSTFGVGLGGGVSLGTTYTAYTSPNAMFSTIKEIAVKASADGRGFKPYGLIAFEFDTDPAGLGQADAGAHPGRYVEFGAMPGYRLSRVALSVPIQVGLSAGDYYEQNIGTSAQPVYVDHAFGYFSVAGVATVPLGRTTRFGTWNVHGGLTFQKLGDTTTALNGGEDTKVIVAAGLGFTY